MQCVLPSTGRGAVGGGKGACGCTLDSAAYVTVPCCVLVGVLYLVAFCKLVSVVLPLYLSAHDIL